MCTILTVNKELFGKYANEIIAQIKADNISNRDGTVLLAIDPIGERNNIMLKSFNIGVIISEIEYFFAEAQSEDARIFLHQRLATGSEIHLGTCHGFNSTCGKVLMHNGFFENAGMNSAVDSFGMQTLIDFRLSPKAIASRFSLLGESYVNMFAIDCNDLSYTVIRMERGTLYTDDNGNFSSRPIAKVIDFPVDSGFADKFSLGLDALIGNDDKYDYLLNYADAEYMNHADDYISDLLPKIGKKRKYKAG